MANKKFRIALQKSIDHFKSDYLQVSREQFTEEGKLIHPGEFGREREKICKRLFEKFCAPHISIGQGFIINAVDETSKEQDLIFYDKKGTPILNTEEGSFFPVETVVGVCQVKSIIHSKGDLKQALLELAEVKKMREKIPHPGVVRSQQKTLNGPLPFHPEKFFYDQIFTILVCEKFGFEISAQEIDEMYPAELPARYKHNCILDIEKGIYQYTAQEEVQEYAFPYPEVDSKGVLQPRFNPAVDEYDHILHLLQNLSILSLGTTTLHVELGDYYH